MLSNAMIGLCGGIVAPVAALLAASAQSAPNLKAPQIETKAIGVPSRTAGRDGLKGKG